MSIDYEYYMDERVAQRQAEREARELELDKENQEGIENPDIDYELENPDLDDWEENGPNNKL